MRLALFSSRLTSRLLNVALILVLLGAIVLSAWLLFSILSTGGGWITSLLLTFVVGVALLVWVGGVAVLLELLVVRWLGR